MTAFCIFWGAVTLIGVLLIMSGYSKASADEKATKKRNAFLFVVAIAVLLLCGILGVFRGCNEVPDSDPSEWVRHS